MQRCMLGEAVASKGASASASNAQQAAASRASLETPLPPSCKEQGCACHPPLDLCLGGRHALPQLLLALHALRPAARRPTGDGNRGCKRLLAPGHSSPLQAPPPPSHSHAPELRLQVAQAGRGDKRKQGGHAGRRCRHLARACQVQVQQGDTALHGGLPHRLSPSALRPKEAAAAPAPPLTPSPPAPPCPGAHLLQLLAHRRQRRAVQLVAHLHECHPGAQERRGGGRWPGEMDSGLSGEAGVPALPLAPPACCPPASPVPTPQSAPLQAPGQTAPCW